MPPCTVENGLLHAECCEKGEYNMKYIFCSSVYNMADYDEIARKSKVPASLADHNLNYNIILGLDETTGHPVTLVNNVQIPSYPKFPKILFHKQKWSHTKDAGDINCGFINLPVLKHLSRAVTTFGGLRREIRAAGKEPVCVMTYDLHVGICIAMRLAKLFFPRIHTCAVLPDIPNAVILASNDGNITAGGKFRAGIKMSFIKQFDSYVLLTEYMKTVAGLGDKPCTIVEGIYNNHQPPLPEKTTDKKVIFYSGQLNPAYGMENLLEAFQQIYAKDKSYELWICGSGGLVERITKLSEECPGVKYYGYVGGDRVRQLQAEASALVNPRQNTEEFTKYSFPSKTMEYLASGRPVVGYKLDGIPEEYDAYIQYVPDNSVEALRDKLIEVCEMPAQERVELGARCRTFILENKTPEKQCQKIRKIMESLLVK